MNGTISDKSTGLKISKTIKGKGKSGPITVVTYLTHTTQADIARIQDKPNNTIQQIFTSATNKEGKNIFSIYAISFIEDVVGITAVDGNSDSIIGKLEGCSYFEISNILKQSHNTDSSFTKINTDLIKRGISLDDRAKIISEYIANLLNKLKEAL